MQRIARPTFARFVRAATVSIQDEEHFGTLTGKGKAVVQFTAKWCGPCQGIKPSIQKLSDTETDVSFLVVDVDEVPVCSADTACLRAAALLLSHAGAGRGAQRDADPFLRRP